MLRMAGLETAADLLGKGRLADELCITVRALNYKIGANRGISDCEIVSAAVALESEAVALKARVEKVLSHARKLRDVLPDAHPGRTLG
jgi:hypothetical protein